MKRRHFTATALAAAATAKMATTTSAGAAEPAWIDTHTHVFVRDLPMAIDARYRPDYDASWETLLALAEKNGVGRAVILQPSFLGFDNEYLFRALRAEPTRLRGVPWISPSVKVTAEDWDNLARIGVRGLRLPIFGLPTPQWSYYEDMLAEARKRDWPIHLYVESKRLPEVLPVLLDGGNKVVIPHYGMFDRTLGPARDPGVKVLLERAPSRNLWVVMCGAYRVGPERARSATSMLLDAFGADRLMWASDWPHTDTDLNRSRPILRLCAGSRNGCPTRPRGRRFWSTRRPSCTDSDCMMKASFAA
jgi:predicted TIM-barrel fold metal-dependent hydrolase